MRLTLAEFPVRQIRLGSVSGYHDELLEVDREDLIRLVRQDARIEQCATRRGVRRANRCASPASAMSSSRESSSIVTAQVFPGVIGPVMTVGDGVTHRLSGMAVLAAAAYEGTIRAGTGVQRSAILDMWGAGAAASRFSAPAPSGVDLGNSRRPGRTGSAPGDSARGVPSRVQSSPRRPKDWPRRARRFCSTLAQRSSRPRVVLIQGCITQAQQPHAGVSYYGLPIRESLPTATQPQ